MGTISAITSYRNGVNANDYELKTNNIPPFQFQNKCDTYSPTSTLLSLETNDNVVTNNENVFQEVVVEEEENIIYADYLITSSIFPTVLNVALELNLLGIMARAAPSCQMSAAEIAAQLSCKKLEESASMLDRILRLLASNRLLTCSIDKVDGRNKLKDAILEGGNPFQMAHGKSAFEYASIDESFNQIFNSAMRNYSTIMMKYLVEKYHGFKDVKQLVEVAGGFGHIIRNIVSKYPSIKGINFDLPHVIQKALPIP
ncbi:hypothetical protein KSS87_013071, partial [Heliosperma pusillum]